MVGNYSKYNNFIQYPIYRFFVQVFKTDICFVNNVRNQKYLREFGKRLRELRMKKGLTQEILAENSGIGRNQVGLIERGEVNVTISTLKQLSKHLGVHPKDLLDF